MAKFVVTGEELDGVDRMMCEIKCQLRQKKGSPLDPKRVRWALQDILEGSFGKGNIIEVLRAWGYLDTSFEGKETHPLTIRPLTKEQAFAEYRNSGGETSDKLEENIYYVVPKEETLEVMIMKFNRKVESDEGLEIMDKFGVRPISLEQLIQYGIARPNHQKRNPLVSLAKILLDGYPRAPLLSVGDVGRWLFANHWYLGDTWDDKYRFPVVCK